MADEGGGELSIELHTRGIAGGEEQSQGSALPPCDRGWAAWRLLLVAFIFETLLWGFPLSFGVFQEYYSRLPQFQDSPYVGVIGTVASGISYIAAPIVIPFVERHARHRRQMIWVGWPLCLLGLVAGSFAGSLGTLILTQGVMYGVGFVTFYYPILSMVNEYWVDRRGMAYGLLCSASGFAGASIPFAMQALLERYGYAVTLRAAAIGLAILTGPLLPLLQGRGPEANVSTTVRTDWSFVRHRPFWIYNISNALMGFGFFFPALYLPSIAVSNGLPPMQGALLLALMSVAQVFGQMSFGYASDRRVSITLLTATSSLVGAVAVLTCWALAHTFAVLAVFALVYGFFASGYTAVWARIGTSISDQPSAAFAAFGLLNLGKGLGNVLAGPIGGALTVSLSTGTGYGSVKYERIVLFTGSCMLASGEIILLDKAWHALKH